MRAVLKLLFLLLCSFSLMAQRIETVWGSVEIEEPVLLELIESWPVQRMKALRHSGLAYYLGYLNDYSRYDYALGSLILLREQGASIEAQIGALLQNVSHTAFSETGAQLFGRPLSHVSYQEMIHFWFLERSGMIDLLQRHGFEIETIQWGKFEDPMEAFPFDRGPVVCLGEAIQRAIGIGAMTMSDLYWGIDEQVWVSLHSIEDPIVQEKLSHIDSTGDLYATFLR